MKGTTGEDLAMAARRRRRIAWIAVAVLAVGGGLASMVYKPWRLRSLHRSSRTAIERGDYRTAAFLARRALQMDPKFVPACVTMAEAGEHDRFPEAVFWREQVLRLVGESTDALVGLASTALSFGKVATARSALLRIPENDHGREDFIVLSGAIALEDKKYEESGRFYEEAVRLNPGKAEYRLALGRTKSLSTDYLIREDGRRILLELATHPALGVTAMRLVIANCETHQEYQAALRHAEELVTLPSHTFSDEVLRLRLLHKTDAPNFAAELAATQEKTRPNLPQAGALLLAMSLDGLAKEGLEWVMKRTPKLGQSPQLRPAIAGCYLTLNDWRSLLAITQLGEWPAAEFVRHAYRARAYRERSESAMVRTEWNLAVDGASRKVDALTWLAQMASEWNWVVEKEQALWALLTEAPGLRWAIEELQKSCIERNDTLGLRRIALHLVESDPNDDNARNDLALVSLLLDVEPERARLIAEELYTKHPENAAFNSTHAFALYSVGRIVDALEVLEKLPAADLESPSIAAYYGIMLAANNAPAKALHFLEIGQRAPLLREEQDLVAKAELLIQEADK